MGMFSKMREAPRGGRSNFISQPGRYVARIDECSQFEIETPSRKDCFKCDLTIMHVVDDVDGRSHRVGEVVTFFRNDRGFTYLQDIKDLVMVATDTEDPKLVGEEELVAITDKRQALAGYYVEFTVSLRPQKKADESGQPKMWPNIKWVRSVEEEEVMRLLTPEQLERFFPSQEQPPRGK